jgi:hypothetical protein
MYQDAFLDLRNEQKEELSRNESSYKVMKKLLSEFHLLLLKIFCNKRVGFDLVQSWRL